MMSHSHCSLILSIALACVFNTSQASTQSAPLTPNRLEEEAWKLTELAYKNYNAGRYERAQTQTELAIQLRPDLAKLRLLLLYTLQKQGKLKEANQVAIQAIQSGLGTPELRRAQANLKPAAPATKPRNPATLEQPKGFALATEAYADYQRANYQAAARGAQQAFQLNPNQGAWALLWLDALEKQHLYAEAVQAADSAIALGAPNKNELINRRQVLQDNIDTEGMPALDATPDQQSPAASAYAAYANQDYQQAITDARKAVEQEPDNPALRRLLATTLAAGTVTQAHEAQQLIDLELQAKPTDPGLLMQRGYLRQRLKQPTLALEDFRAARASGQAPANAILDEAYAQAAAGDKRGATTTFMQSIDQSDAGQLELSAQQRYDTRNTIAQLSREWGGYVSAGYRGARPAGTGLGGVAITEPGDAIFSTAELFWRPSDFLNSTHQNFEAYGRISNTLWDRGSTTTSQTLPNPCPGQPSLSVNTQKNKGITGFPTTTGALGVRYTPSTDIGLTFGLERQFLLGTAARSGTITPQSDALRCQANLDHELANYQTRAGNGGWMAYTTYGFYEGSALRVDTPSWFSMEGYVQAGYSWQDLPAQFTVYDSRTNAIHRRDSGRVQREQAFGTAELRIGRSWRLSPINDRLVVFPYAVVGGDWLWTRNKVNGLSMANSKSFELLENGSTWSLGAGPGINFRYWFRENHYNAPRSYLNLSVQYRFDIGGAADRARGLFINMTMSY